MNRGTRRAFFLVPASADLVLLLALGGCGRAPSAEAPVGATAPLKTEAPVAIVAPPTSTPPSPLVELSAVAAVPFTRGAVLETDVPSKFSRADVARLRWRRLPGADPAWLLLDQHAPRFFHGPSLELGRLYDEDEEMAPGPHRLVAVRREAAGYVLQEAAFWLETEQLPTRASGCLLLAPSGTFNGDQAADAIDIVVFAWGPEVQRLTVELGPPERARKKIVSSVVAGSASIFRPSLLPSGDYAISVDCLGSAGESIERLDRTITVNRDAPTPEARP